MSAILSQAQALVARLQTIMPSIYQQDSLQALLGLFLEAQGSPLPEHCKTKSARSLSRFLNEYKWSTRQVIGAVRQAACQQIMSQPKVGCRPTLQVIIDLTTLEKAGKFKEFQHLVRVYNGKRGLHVVLLYIVVGRCRVPFTFSSLPRQGYSNSFSIRIASCPTIAEDADPTFQSFSSSWYRFWQQWICH